MPSDSDPTFDYCPFCGMRLPREGLDAHLEEYADCAARREAHGRTGSGELAGLEDRAARRTGLSTGQTVMLGVFVVVILAYSFLISQQLLLGVLASAIVVVAFLVTARR